MPERECTPSPVVPHSVAQHFGTCDASAAVALGSSLFVVASDEDSVMRFYARNHDGPPIAEIDVADALDIGNGRESDIEGAAWLGKRVFWISSHDRKGKGARYSFFATRIDFVNGHPRLRLDGEPYRDLLRDLLADDAAAAYGLEEASLLDPKSDGGLNIEGLGRAGDDRLYIGLRNPIPDGRALLFTLKNPKKVVRKGKRCRFGKPISLDLDGLGIRAIDQLPNGAGNLIVAGPHDARGDFRLFEWSGSGDDDPVERLRFSKTWYVEALLSFPGDDRAIHVISDDGRRMIGGRVCKDQAEDRRRFRSGRVCLP